MSVIAATPRARDRAARTPGARTPGARTPGARTPGARTPGGTRALAAGALVLAAGGCAGEARGTAADSAQSTAQSAAPIAIGAENAAIVAHDTVEAGPLISGTVEAEQTATLRAQLAGTVRQTGVEAGERVRRGTLLAVIEDRTLDAALASARARVASAEAAARVAAREVQRQQRLLAIEAVAERAVETAEETLIANQAALAEARASAASAREQLAFARVTAPFAGVVSARSVSRGDVVQSGAELFRLVEPSALRLEGSVPAEQLSSVRVGMPVAFAVRGYPGRTFAGRVTRINPAADPSTRQVRVYASIPNAGAELVSGLFATGRLASARRVGLAVPLAAVNARGTSPGVVRVRGGVVEWVAVRLGLRDERAGRALVVAGVRAGDTLLTGAPRDLAAGTRVRVTGWGAAAPSAVAASASPHR